MRLFVVLIASVLWSCDMDLFGHDEKKIGPNYALVKVDWPGEFEFRGTGPRTEQNAHGGHGDWLAEAADSRARQRKRVEDYRHRIRRGRHPRGRAASESAAILVD